MRILFLLLALCPFLINAQTVHVVKPLNYVTDQSDVLTPEQEQELNNKLRIFEDETSNQLFVYTAPSLNGNNLEEVSRIIFNTWGIGQKGKNNGILIAIFTSDQVFRIQVGYGLEKQLPEHVCKAIQDLEMKQHFKSYNFYRGIDVGVDKLIFYSQNDSGDYGKFPWFIMIGLFVVSLIMLLLTYLFSFGLKKQQPKVRKNILVTGSIILLIPFASVFFMFILLIYTIVKLIGQTFNFSFRSRSSSYEDDTNYHERSQRRERDRNNDSSSDDSDFSGGGGGSSGSGGSSSSW